MSNNIRTGTIIWRSYGVGGFGGRIFIVVGGWGDKLEYLDVYGCV